VKALVTGVGGFCGPHLVARLRRDGNIEIAGVDQMAAEPSGLKLDAYFSCDVSEEGQASSVVQKFLPDAIFHLAGLSGRAVPAPLVYSVNVMGAVHVLESVRSHAPNSRVLLAGSAAEYGPADISAMPLVETTPCKPIGAYGLSKYAATLIGMDYAREFGLKVVVARPTNIIGPGLPKSLVVGALIDRAQRALASSDPVVELGDFDSERDFVAVADVVDAYVRLVQAGLSGEIFNLSSGRAYPIRKVAEILLANSTRPIKLKLNPDLIPASPIRSLYASYEKAARAIGFHPVTSLEDALRAAWSSETEVNVV
jgi:GDP-4-dehydro-6-deoxy-D-mannose reductase